MIFFLNHISKEDIWKFTSIDTQISSSWLEFIDNSNNMNIGEEYSVDVPKDVNFEEFLKDLGRNCKFRYNTKWKVYHMEDQEVYNYNESLYVNDTVNFIYRDDTDERTREFLSCIFE